MTNFLRCLPLALLFGILSCSEEAPTASPESDAAGDSELMTSAADAAQLPEVRYYVVSDG
ncbi:MAG TPA: hypothetical protein EYQ74_11990 [Planctomycetes bacterium]|nr:hypothetical protein [Planctomycetota bacterium]HIK61701.1 hypothetical protein [Planctomycetota bacterium]